MNNKSPLRYPGGKTRACKILDSTINQFFDIKKFDTIISPFLGGGSFEFHIQNNYNLEIIANDKFEPLYTFWKIAIENKSKLCSHLNKYINTVSKEMFNDFRNKIMNEEDLLLKAVYYFIINRCSFSGATLSGGFSSQSAIGRFTESSVQRIQNLNLSKFKIYNLDFEEFINTYYKNTSLLFLDPPYFLEKKSKLYGNNGDMHETFKHDQLFKCLENKKNWIMTYNNCDYIKNLYKKFTIIETNWSYGMCNVKSKTTTDKQKQKTSSEIIIISI